jgi:hypothetical protein
MNPCRNSLEPFQATAKRDGIKYRDLLHRILTLGMQRAAGTVARVEKAQGGLVNAPAISAFWGKSGRGRAFRNVRF